MIDIAMYSEDGGTVAVSSISSRQNISVKYLEQILISLRQAHLIRSVKGSKGGYVVDKPTDEITFREIIDALDVTILGDVSFHDDGDESPLKSLLSSLLWDNMTSYLREFSESITLSDIIKKYREISPGNEEIMYYI